VYQPINSKLRHFHPIDAPLNVILDLWYTVFGDTVLDYTYEDLEQTVTGDWLADNIRRVVARLVVEIAGSKWDAWDSPYTVNWQWNNASQKVQAVLKLMKETDGNYREQGTTNPDAKPGEVRAHPQAPRAGG
jgi:hypothetical protein